MYKVFTIVQVRDNWVQLVHIPTLLVISASTKIEDILPTLYKYVGKYKTANNLEKRMAQILKDLPVSLLSQENTIREIKSTGGKYDEIVRQTVDDAMDKIHKSRNLKHTAKRKRIIKVESAIIEEELFDFSIDLNVGKIMKPKIRKRILLQS